ncbi:unnamed protein product, partial [Rhizoctonia solani]
MKVALKKGAPLGFGGFSTVYRATELHTGLVVALKQSRASRKLRRTLLQHEAQVLIFLAGHPAIPQVYAYGRIEHFELLAMELLDQTLGDAVEARGPLSLTIVSDIADQLLSALEHIHNKGVVHRDIKPDNILLVSEGSWNIRLIDFGFAYPAPTEIPAAEYLADPSQSTTVFGTLLFASLNAHEGLKLTYRDDLESSAYTFLYLLRGNLPWAGYASHGTVHGRIRQVRAQKRRLHGAHLATGLPTEFGELVDYARSLSTTEIPNYQGWRGKLTLVARLFNKQEYSVTGDPCRPLSGSEASNTGLLPPLRLGQVALVGLLSSVTAEGYSIQVGREKSYIPDPRFSTSEWESSVKPCVILQVEWVSRDNTYKFTAVPISQNPELENDYTPKVSIISPGSSSSEPSGIVIEPDWPFQGAYCYAFKRPTVFYCLPSQALVPCFWMIDPNGVDSLLMTLSPPPCSRLHDSESPELDTRDDAKLRSGYVKLYAGVYPLDPTEAPVKAADWNSTRAWFDECVKAARHYEICDGIRWTDACYIQDDDEVSTG